MEKKMLSYYLGGKKMNYFDGDKINFFKGIGELNLGMKYDKVIQLMKKRNMIYSMGFDTNKGCTPQVLWKKIFLKNYMTLWFAEDILWQICFEKEFKGSLENGIKIGTSIDFAKLIDDELQYDDWNENWTSNKGYWLFDEIDTNTVVSFSIVIKEALDDDEFYSYKWIDKYK